MKKSFALLSAACLSAGLLSGCGANYDAAKSTIFILSSGKVILTEVATFDEETYDKNDLVGFTADNIDYYNEQAGKKCIKLKKLYVKDNSATMTLEFASVDDYCSFTGYYLVCGKISDLEAQGIAFDGDYVSLDRKNNPTACDSDALYDGKSYTAVIASGDFDIQVPKSVAFLSATGGIMDTRRKVTIDPTFNILTDTEDNTVLGTESVKKTEVTKDAAAGTQSSSDGSTGSASDGSISEDDLLAVGEEEETDTEEFDFDAEYAANADNFEEADPEAYNNIRVYIIY